MYTAELKINVDPKAFYLGSDRTERMAEIAEYIVDLFYDLDTIDLKNIYIEEVVTDG